MKDIEHYREAIQVCVERVRQRKLPGRGADNYTRVAMPLGVLEALLTLAIAQVKQMEGK